MEDLRAKIANPDLRTSYFATVKDYYQIKTDILMLLHRQQPRGGYNKQALENAERSRARTLIELLTESQANIRQGISPELQDRETNLRQRLSSVETRRLELASSNYKPDRANALDVEEAKLAAEYERLQTKIRTNSPRYAALKYPRELSLTQIQRLLDRDTVLLEYSLGEKRSYLWAVTKNSLKSYEIPNKAQIQTAARNLYALLAEPRFSNSEKVAYSKAVRDLSQLVIAPAAKELGKKRLVVVSDGGLAYIPFAALSAPNSNQPLLVNREVIHVPSAGVIYNLRQNKRSQIAPKTIAIMADPVFSKDDDRVKPARPQPMPAIDKLELELAQRSLQRSADESSIEFERLKNTRTEAENIAKLVPKDSASVNLDFDANLDRLDSSKLSQYRIVHLATHGILNSVNPGESGVVLSLVNPQGQPENGFLRLRDIFNLNLAADLVVLSACETGLGKEIRGEGVIGLTRGFMYAGAPRVVVSLWSVDDAATAKLMTKFYQGMLAKGLTPAAALRQAQLEMKKQGFAPYYWAPFTLQGEWQ